MVLIFCSHSISQSQMNGLPPKKNSVRCESVEHKKETNYSLVTFNKNRVDYRGFRLS